jgi:hypothetical protein
VVSRNFLIGEIVAKPREKFASQLDKELLDRARSYAEKEGLQFQSLLESAIREYLDNAEGDKPRKAVVQALAESINQFDDLYEALAQ